MGILDYLSQKVDNAKNTITGGVSAAYTEAKDVTTKALMPPKAAWAKNEAGKWFDSNKYRSDQYSYPSDLLTPQYGGNYAIFYINVSDASKLNVKENTFNLNDGIEPRLRGSLVANAEALTKSIQGTIGQLNKVLPEAGQIDMETVKNAVPFNARSQRRLKTAIALHIPNQLSVSYRTSWGEEGTAGMQAGMQAGNSVLDAVATNGAAVKKNMTDVAAVGAEAGFALGLSKLPPGAGSALGLASNPKKEQVFEGVDFRKFTFDYQFYPRDEAEAQNVLNIIHQFKLHMHPEFKSELNYVWIYPSEFDIAYYTKNKENEHIHRHTSCVLTEMNVNYTPNGQFTSFANGMPTQINITLSFRELGLLNKDLINQGL
jgi:hypothetical protein